MLICLDVRYYSTVMMMIYIMLQSDAIISILCSSGAFSASAGNSSVPVAFPYFIDFNAFYISSFVMITPLVTSNLGIYSLRSSYSSVIYSTHLWCKCSSLRRVPFQTNQPCILFTMDVDKNTGLPHLHSSHLWLVGIGSAHRWPHHGTSPRLACKTK